MNLVYKIVHTIVLWFLPVLLVLTSFMLLITNADLHKSTLSESDFYQQLSESLTGEDIQRDSQNVSVTSVVLSAVLSDIATESWLQNVFERNIDLSTQWLSGERENWEAFIPAEEVQQSLAKNIDEEIKLYIEQNETIPPCNFDDALAIREQGYSDEFEFCIPPSVISGEQTLTQFMGLNDEALQDDFLQGFFQDNDLSTQTNQANVADLVGSNDENASRINIMNTIRDGYLGLRDTLLFLWLIMFGCITASILLAKSASKTFVGEAQRLLFFGGINTLILSLTLILIFGGTNYITSVATEFILPGLLSSQVNSLIFWQLVRFSFNVLSLAIGISLGMIILRVAIFIAKRFNFIGNVEAKNQKLFGVNPSIERNPTLDGEFQREVQKKSLLGSAPVSQITASEIDPEESTTFTFNTISPDDTPSKGNVRGNWSDLPTPEDDVPDSHFQLHNEQSQFIDNQPATQMSSTSGMYPEPKPIPPAPPISQSTLSSSVGSDTLIEAETPVHQESPQPVTPTPSPSQPSIVTATDSSKKVRGL